MLAASLSLFKPSHHFLRLMRMGGGLLFYNEDQGLDKGNEDEGERFP